MLQPMNLFDNKSTSYPIEVNTEEDIYITPKKENSNSLYAQLFKERLSSDKDLRMKMHLKWIFSKLIDNNFYKSSPIYHINGYYDALNRNLSSDNVNYSYYIKGAEWINESFTELYKGASLISSLPLELSTAFKLLSIFVGKNKYNNIAFALARSYTGKVNHLQKIPVLIKKSMLYSSFVALDKQNLLAFLDLKDLLKTLDNIFTYWESSNISLPIQYGCFEEPLVYLRHSLLQPLIRKLERHYYFNSSCACVKFEELLKYTFNISISSEFEKYSSTFNNIFSLKTYLLQCKFILDASTDSDLNSLSCLNLSEEYLASLTYNESIDIYSKLLATTKSYHKMITSRRVSLDYRKTPLLSV